MTAAPEKVAPVVVVVGGREVPVSFSTNGLCSVEESYGGMSLEAIGRQMESGGTSTRAVRAIFRAILLPEMPGLSEVEAGRIVGDIGLEETAAVIQSAFNAWKGGADVARSPIGEPNPKGEVAFQVDGRRYKLAFAFNALAEIEPVFPGMTMPQIAASLLEGGVSVVRMRAMFRAALIDHLETSLFEAGEIMDVVGLATVSDAVGKAFSGAFPKVPEEKGDQEGEADTPNRKKRRAAAAKGDPANPTKPRPRKGGTGKP